MFFIVGVGSRVKPSGQGGCTCPACGKHVFLSASKKYSVLTLFFIPILSFGSTYVVTCPSCASILGLNKKTGRQLESNPETQIFPEDLDLLHNHAGTSCSHCGTRVSPSHNYCSNCGQRT